MLAANHTVDLSWNPVMQFERSNVTSQGRGKEKAGSRLNQRGPKRRRRRLNNFHFELDGWFDMISLVVSFGWGMWEKEVTRECCIDEQVRKIKRRQNGSGGCNRSWSRVKRQAWIWLDVSCQAPELMLKIREKLKLKDRHGQLEPFFVIRNVLNFVSAQKWSIFAIESKISKSAESWKGNESARNILEERERVRYCSRLTSSA